MSFLLRSDTEVNTPRAMTSRSILPNHNLSAHKSKPREAH